MTINILETNLNSLKDIFAARKIPDLEHGCKDEGLELSLDIYQLEEASDR